jgi:hypothetical protein
VPNCSNLYPYPKLRSSRRASGREVCGRPPEYGSRLEPVQASSDSSQEEPFCSISLPGTKAEKPVVSAHPIAWLTGALKAVRLDVSEPSHCPLLEPVADALKKSLQVMRLQQPKMVYVGSSWGPQVVELAGRNAQPRWKSSDADLGLLRPTSNKIHDLIPHNMRHPALGQSSPRLFFSAMCSAISSARTSSLVWTLFSKNSIRFCFSST